MNGSIDAGVGQARGVAELSTEENTAEQSLASWTGRIVTCIESALLQSLHFFTDLLQRIWDVIQSIFNPLANEETPDQSASMQAPILPQVQPQEEAPVQPPVQPPVQHPVQPRVQPLGDAGEMRRPVISPNTTNSLLEACSILGADPRKLQALRSTSDIMMLTASAQQKLHEAELLLENNPERAFELMEEAKEIFTRIHETSEELLRNA